MCIRDSVLFLAGDTPELRDVLGGLPHRDVGVGKVAFLARVGPGLAAGRELLGARPRLVEHRVLGVGKAVTVALDVPADRLHSGRDENVALPSPCLLYTSPSPRDRTRSRMPSSA